MEYSPPPLFKQGASARVKVVFFSLIAIGLLVADARVRSLTIIRQAAGTVLYPLQIAALVPRDLSRSVTNYFTTLSAVQRENLELKRRQAENAQMLQQAQQLAAENNQLRKLLGTAEQLAAPSLMSEILYDARDAGSRKIVVNRGIQDSVLPGQPVIDDVGVVGQVTRVFPFSSEVTLLTDKDQAIPVQVVRSGLRSVAYGRGSSGVLDLRFMAANADIQNGDVLVTSGIDGVYPPGLAVAKVIQVENKSSDAFARILCLPTAGIDRNRQLLILLANTDVAPRPQSEEDRDKKDNLGRRRTRELFREAREASAAQANGAGPATNLVPAPSPASATASVSAPIPSLPAARGAVAPTVLRDPVRPAVPVSTLTADPAAAPTAAPTTAPNSVITPATNGSSISPAPRAPVTPPVRVEPFVPTPLPSNAPAPKPQTP